MLLEIVLITILLMTIDFCRNLHLTHTLPNVATVSRIPFIGGFLRLRHVRPDNFVETWHAYSQRYGKTFYNIAMGRLFVLTTDHRIVDVLLASPEHLQKNRLYQLLGGWLGSGLLISSGPTWHQMRKIITPTFHFKILEQFIEIFDRQTDVFIEKLRPKANGLQAVEVFEPVGRLTMDILAETAMGVRTNSQMDSKSEFVQAVNTVTEIIAYRFVRPHLLLGFLFKLFAPEMYNKHVNGIKIMHKFTEKIIKERRELLERSVNESTNDNLDKTQQVLGIKKRMALLDVLLQSSMNDGKPIPDKQIRDEVNTFMFAGHDTTTSAITFCLYALSRHAEVQQKLYDEIRQHFGEDLKRPVTYGDLQDLPYLNCVIKEALRLYPPVPAIGRWITSELQVDDCIFPPRSDIIVVLIEMLRDPNIFEDPLTFKPERHLECNNVKFNAYTNIPFSAGPRNCIGQRFALFEMRTVIIKVLSHYELLPLGEEIQLTVQIVLRPKHGAEIGLRPRQ